ncbi:MAG: helix-hairpin-helix domain-containing protein [Clostridiales bacterium]|jgi:hypothetical protein|nr:helix-hairpin-helix domain-containing protein [Clostridiales bacterium]
MAEPLTIIPGIGKNMEQHLKHIGYNCVEDLVGQNPEVIYEKDCIFQGCKVDRCCLYVYRLAVAFAEKRIDDPEKLKWWNWKD